MAGRIALGVSWCCSWCWSRSRRRRARGATRAPTNSSPISISADGKWVWSVNPGAGNVSVIYTKTNKVVATIKTGDEPQSVALDPNNRYAYVANAGVRHRHA